MTTLIKNILLIDGSGQAAVKADVLIKNERIAAIGLFPRYQADTVIDGIGAYLAPGFIDSNTNSDRYLTIFSNPQQRHFLLQGITTIIGGQDGLSLAPLLYGSLDLQKFWADPHRINVDWHTLKELLRVLRRRSLGVNFGTFVGHSTLRHTIIGDDFRDLTAKELDVLQYLLTAAMRDGAFGVSFDLQSPVAALTPAKEIRLILETVERYRGVATFRIRSGSDMTVYGDDAKDQFPSAVSEIIHLSKETSARVLIGNFSPPHGFEHLYRNAIELIEEQAAVADVHFSLHPFDHSIVPISSFLPLWAQRGGTRAVLQHLASPDLASKIASDMANLSVEDSIIHDAPGFDYLVGKTLRSLGADRGTELPTTLIDLMRLTKLRASLVYKGLSLAEFNRALLSDRSLIVSAGASFEEQQSRTRLHLFADAMPVYLGKVLADKVISLEAAIAKITGAPAQRLGLKQRGFVREGYFADLVLFRDSHIESVFVNGAMAVRDGACTGTLNGNLLQHADK